MPTELQDRPKGMFTLVKRLKTDSKEVGGRCIRESDGKLCLGENEG